MFVANPGVLPGAVIKATVEPPLEGLALVRLPAVASIEDNASRARQTGRREPGFPNVLMGYTVYQGIENGAIWRSLQLFNGTDPDNYWDIDQMRQYAQDLALERQNRSIILYRDAVARLQNLLQYHLQPRRCDSHNTHSTPCCRSMLKIGRAARYDTLYRYVSRCIQRCGTVYYTVRHSV